MIQLGRCSGHISPLEMSFLALADDLSKSPIRFIYVNKPLWKSPLIHHELQLYPPVDHK